MVYITSSKLGLVFVLAELTILGSRIQTAHCFRQELIKSLDILKNIFNNVSVCDIHFENYTAISSLEFPIKGSICDQYQFVETQVVSFMQKLQKDANNSTSKLLSQVHAVRNRTMEYFLSHLNSNSSLFSKRLKILNELNCSINLPKIDWKNLPQNFMDPEFILKFDFEDEYNKRRLLDGCAFVLLLLILSIILPSISIKELFQQLFMRQKIILMSINSGNPSERPTRVIKRTRIK